MDDDTVDVLVVGAGPSGLMAAVCLARAGVRVAVVDGKHGPTRESRALAVQARSMELYDQLGLADTVLAAADVAPRIVPGFGRRAFGSLSFTEFGRTLTPYPGIFVLEQHENERILGETYRVLGGEVSWGQSLVDLRMDADASHPVAASLRTESGERTIHARYAIAADGASSTVRKLLDIPFEGTTNPLRFYVADAHGVAGLVAGAVNVRFSDDDFLLAFPMGAPGHDRLLGVLDEDADDPESVVRRRIAAAFGVTFDETAWFSEYRVHHRLARAFRRGPVFLVGDAAHVHSPVGAQGMNTGLQDAHNLACKLIDVLVGGADAGWLDRYEPERRPVAARLVGTTDAVFARITAATGAGRFMRGEVLPRVAPVGVRMVPRMLGTERVYGYLSQLRIHYRMPGYEQRRRRGRIVGRRLAWSGDNHEVLRRFSWQVHGYGAAGRAAARVGDALGLDAFAFPPDRHGRLEEDRLFLVRPDGFVAAAARPPHAASAFAHALPQGLRGIV